MTDLPLPSTQPESTASSPPVMGRDPVTDRAIMALRDVWDPELALDVFSLGLIYDIRVTDDVVEVDMTLTTPGCPVSESLSGEADAALREALPDFEIVLNVIWDPPWTPERLSEEALETLGYRR